MSISSCDLSSLLGYTGKANARAAQTRANSRQALSFENMILASQSRETVLLTKIPMSARRLKGREVVAIRSPVDFFGMYIPTGRLLVFDAKSSKGLYRLETREEHFATHQRAMILRYGEAGSHAGILAESVERQGIYWCDWKLLIKPRPSILWEDMAYIGPSSGAIKWKLIFGA